MIGKIFRPFSNDWKQFPPARRLARKQVTWFWTRCSRAGCEIAWPHLIVPCPFPPRTRRSASLPLKSPPGGSRFRATVRLGNIWNATENATRSCPAKRKTSETANVFRNLTPAMDSSSGGGILLRPDGRRDEECLAQSPPRPQRRGREENGRRALCWFCGKCGCSDGAGGVRKAGKREMNRRTALLAGSALRAAPSGAPAPRAARRQGTPGTGHTTTEQGAPSQSTSCEINPRKCQLLAGP